MSENIEKLFAFEQEVVIGEEKFVIKPFKFGQLPKVLNVFKQIQLPENGQPADIIVAVLSQNPDGLQEILALSVNKTKDWIEQLDIDKAVELGIAVFKVNVDFFIHSVLPHLNKTIQRTTSTSPGQTQ